MQQKTLRSWPDPSDHRHTACIVLGCRERPIACCYTRHGRTAYCPSHDPIRLGMVRPYQYPALREQPTASSSPSTEPSTNGPTPPRVRPFGPVTPPPAPAGNAQAFTYAPPAPVLADVEF